MPVESRCKARELPTTPLRDFHGVSRRLLLGGALSLLASAKSKGSRTQSTDGLEDARDFLRSEQASVAAGAPGFPYRDQENTTEMALAQLRHQRQFEPTADPNIVFRGVFRFDRRPEEERIRRSEELIRRVQPGPYEDPGYFALLAYQAASIEMAHLRLQNRVDPSDPFSRFLLGTVHRACINAFAQRIPRGDYSVVCVNSGLIDFVYQSAKAVVAATNPVRNLDHDGFATAHMDMDKIRAQLKVNQAPVDRVYRTLESCFFEGYPRAFARETVADEQAPFVSILISMAERWITAHEYGHGLALPLDFSQAPENKSWVEEFVADSVATTLTVASGWWLDHLPPEFSLSGAIFALACMDIRRRALSIVTTGEEVRDSGSDTHPPNAQRALQSIATFRRFFDVHYLSNGKPDDMAFVVRDKPPEKHGFGIEQSDHAFACSNVLLAMWPRVKERLREQYKQKRPLHPMWAKYRRSTGT